jgi:hypothetical protein
MPDQWYAVINAETGESYSFGTVLADPMPAEFVAIPLSDADADALNRGRGYWDAASRSVVMRPESDWPVTPEA